MRQLVSFEGPMPLIRPASSLTFTMVGWKRVARMMMMMMMLSQLDGYRLLFENYRLSRLRSADS